MGRELHRASARPEVIPMDTPLPQPTLRELMLAFREVMLRSALFTRHQITREPLSVRERMSFILGRVQQSGPSRFADLCDPDEGRAGVVVCLLAVLEMVKLAMIDLVQERPFAELMIGTASPRPPALDEQDYADDADDAIEGGTPPALY